ncbi:MAG TPA: BadF/BadG/BcrA/BcrD ATPase family protein [Jatrophihabitantaceae bacterium]|nr:BadF/BadG/BcrA/BcrD ATPase family protein [Jatrophihabitantaceae bacterium]
MTEALAVGVDLGGTATRALVVDRAGTVLGAGRAGGGNPTSHGTAKALAELGAALRTALAGVDAARVVSVVLGMAGGGALSDPAIARAYAALFDELGVTASAVLVGDALCAFASATPGPDGTVLLAGTGAIAAAVRGHALARIADGWGWLLGDQGSGYWIGRAAVRAVLAELAGIGPPTALRPLVLAELGLPADVAAGHVVIHAAVSRPPIELARLAETVASQASVDATAASICTRAAELLVDSLAKVRDLAERTPIVLNGSVIRSPDGPVGGQVRRLLSQRFGGPVFAPPDGAEGAAWLALRAVIGDTAAQAAHERIRLTRPA